MLSPDGESDWDVPVEVRMPGLTDDERDWDMPGTTDDHNVPGGVDDHDVPGDVSPVMPEMWISSLNLYNDDKRILESETWLNDNIIYAAQSLLKKQTKGEIFGFQSTQLCKKMHQFRAITGLSKFIQILHINDNHWICVSNISFRGSGMQKDSVDVYDSLFYNSRSTFVKFSTRKLICSFFKSPSDVMTFDLVNIKLQDDDYNCGLFAIACATELAFGSDPAVCNWDDTKMRSHLKCCLEKGSMSRFPSTRRRIPFGCRIRKPSKSPEENIHCVCRMPNEESRAMIECEGCLKWFHHDCVSLDPGM